MRILLILAMAGLFSLPRGVVAQEEAKAARQRARKKGRKAKADDGGKLKYAEAFRVMTLVDQPQES